MSDPHADRPLATAGSPLADAVAAVVLVHGRGATAESILQLSDLFPAGVAALAPRAAGNTWYPRPFTAPIEANEPGRSSGLAAIAAAIDRAEAAGIDRERIALVGFSQGACLASEFLARRPAPTGGLAALSGGLLGEQVDPDDYEGDLAGTPVFLGCSDRDPHIDADRVRATGAVFEALGADVTVRLYERMGHTINAEERDRVRSMVGALVDA